MLWTISLLGCGTPAGPPVTLEVVDVGAFRPEDQKVVFRARDAEGEPADLERAIVEVRITERAADGLPGSGPMFCDGVAAVGADDVDASGTARVVVPFASSCRRAGPGLVGEITVVLTPKSGDPLTVTQTGSSSLQNPDRMPVPPPSAVPAPSGAGLALAPYPLSIVAEGATLGRDSADPSAVIVKTSACEVRVAEPHAMGAPITGASTRSMLSGIGAEFTTDTVADDRWTLAYRIPSLPSWSLNAGLVADGHTYVCRGDYPSPEAQACGAALCSTLAPTGGEAAATHVIDGAFTVHCESGTLCLQTTESMRVAHARSCAMVGAPQSEGPCPEEPRVGACTTPDGMQWVYLEGGLSAADARAQCAEIKGQAVGM